MASLAACSMRNGAFSRAWKSTEIGGEGADTLVRPYRAWHWCEQRAVGKRGQGRLESRPHIGHDTEGTEKTNHREHGEGKPRRTRRTRRWGERRRIEVERAVVRAGWCIELPYISGLRCSAGVNAGMASLAACSTWRRRLGEGGQWVKGAKACWKAGRRLESLSHKRGCPTEAEGEGRKPTAAKTGGVARKTAGSTGRPVWQAKRRAARAAGAIGCKRGTG